MEMYLTSVFFACLGMLTNTYIKALTARRRRSFSLEILLKDNLNALGITFLGILLFSGIFQHLPDSVDIFLLGFGIHLDPEATGGKVLFLFGFSFYAAIRNILKPSIKE
jgi:hypothetical protein